MGYTGNYTAAVWFGNDDYTSTNNMTGGSLPAMTFKKLMDYAHQGIDLKPIMGGRCADAGKGRQARGGERRRGRCAAPMVRPRSLSGQSTRLIRDLGQKMRSAAPLSLPAGPSAQLKVGPETTGSTDVKTIAGFTAR